MEQEITEKLLRRAVQQLADVVSELLKYSDGGPFLRRFACLLEEIEVSMGTDFLPLVGISLNA